MYFIPCAIDWWFIPSESNYLSHAAELLAVFYILLNGQGDSMPTTGHGFRERRQSLVVTETSYITQSLLDRHGFWSS